MDNSFNYHNADIHGKVRYLKEYTDIYKSYGSDRATEREAAILRHQIPAILLPPEPEDRICGRIKFPPVAFSSREIKGSEGYGYVFNEQKIFGLKKHPDLLKDEKEILEDIHSFWLDENFSSKCRNAFPAEIAASLSDLNNDASGVAFSLFSNNGTVLDYSKLLNLGISGLKKIVKEKINLVRAENPEFALYRGMEEALDLLSRVCIYYAEKIAEQEPENKEKADSLRNISRNTPTNLTEAIQLVHFYALVSGSGDYGRMDDYLSAYLDNSGRANKEEVIKDLDSLWTLINFNEEIQDASLVIGGKARRNPDQADKLALMVLEVLNKKNFISPKVSLRCYKAMNDDLFSKALEVISGGSPFPVLYNDDRNIPALASAYRIDEKSAANYVPTGNGKLIPNNRMIGITGGIVNLLKILEVSLRQGKDPVTGDIIATKESLTVDPENYSELCKGYRINLTHYLTMLAKKVRFEKEFAAKTAAFLYTGLLSDSCIGKGKGIFEEGIDYAGGFVEICGAANVADSLLIINKRVFEDDELTLSELVKVLDENFERNEEFWQSSVDMPKYGNDDPLADESMMNVHEEFCKLSMKLADETGLDFFLAVNLNNELNIPLGKKTLASADGRKSGTSLASGNNPSPGMSRHSATSLLNSMAKMRSDIHAGLSHNIRFSLNIVSNYRPMISGLIRSYFDGGGTELRLTVLGKDDLISAERDPEKYRDIRLWFGSSPAYFIELPDDVREELKNQTLY